MKPQRSTEDSDVAVRRVRGLNVPQDIKTSFELGYLAAVMRMKREMPAAWRNRVLAALTEEAPSREEICDLGNDRCFASSVRGLRLVVMRCEAAASMLSWRKKLPAKSQRLLRHAVDRLAAEARRLEAA